MKRAPAKAPDPEKYARRKTLMPHLHTRAMHGECEVWYFDASGFCFTPSMPYAGQPIGSVRTVPTSAQNKRMKVLGFLTRPNDLLPSVLEGRVDTDVVRECFE